MVEQWEYKSFITDGPNLETQLNWWGQQGWECISVVSARWGGSITMQSSNQYRATIKRRKSSSGGASSGSPG